MSDSHSTAVLNGQHLKFDPTDRVLITKDGTPIVVKDKTRNAEVTDGYQAFYNGRRAMLAVPVDYKRHENGAIDGTPIARTRGGQMHLNGKVVEDTIELDGEVLAVLGLRGIDVGVHLAIGKRVAFGMLAAVLGFKLMAPGHIYTSSINALGSVGTLLDALVGWAPGWLVWAAFAVFAISALKPGYLLALTGALYRGALQVVSVLGLLGLWIVNGIDIASNWLLGWVQAGFRFATHAANRARVASGGHDSFTATVAALNVRGAGEGDSLLRYPQEASADMVRHWAQYGQPRRTWTWVTSFAALATLTALIGWNTNAFGVKDGVNGAIASLKSSPPAAVAPATDESATTPQVGSVVNVTTPTTSGEVAAATTKEGAPPTPPNPQSPVSEQIGPQIAQAAESNLAPGTQTPTLPTPPKVTNN